MLRLKLSGECCAGVAQHRFLPLFAAGFPHSQLPVNAQGNIGFTLTMLLLKPRYSLTVYSLTV